MSETFHIKATERGVIRIFMANLTTEQAETFTQSPDEDTPAPINRALGVSNLNTDFIELFPLSNLAGVGLAGYLVEGLGVAEEDVKPHASRLNAMSGQVLIVLSQAFGGFETTITPTAPLKWIGTYTEEGSAVKFEPLPSEGAEVTPGTPTGKPPKSDARVGGMIAMYALIAMFIFVGLLIWVAG
ncbi:hypothetical protein [Roseobacter sp. CCS2]|uniref:hypothetical protein n=1 Tax=Roseobacter sp. CCS2 TaxID=391593 RepID=UPI0000F3E54A|nr:hypothetical protein [Roseobacter sp. CCS2]EBA12090.1 hypothetical protein RCCS2_12374 [Roseobacter sp. CCS2]